MNWRRSVVFPLADVIAVDVEDRSLMEERIKHRALGCGTHNGEKRPNRKRVGSMLADGLAGKEFWAATAGSGVDPLLVLKLRNSDFVSAVLTVDNPQALATELERARTTA